MMCYYLHLGFIERQIADSRSNLHFKQSRAIQWMHNIATESFQNMLLCFLFLNSTLPQQIRQSRYFGDKIFIQNSTYHLAVL